MPRRDLRDAALLALIVGAVVVANAIWLWWNQLPPHWDSANHLISALKYRDVLSSCFVAAPDVIRGFLRCGQELTFVDRAAYAPLFPLLAGALSFVTGGSVTALVMANAPFIALLAGSTYLLGRRLHSRAAGIVAALVVCSYPLLFSTSHEFMMELSLVAFTALGGYLLFVSDHFANRRATLLFGIVSGLALLDKFTFVAFIAGPVALVLWWLLRDRLNDRISLREFGGRLAWVSAAGLIAIALAALWYVPNGHTFLASMQFIAGFNTTGGSRLAPAALLFYANSMIWDVMGVPLFLLFIFGLTRLFTLDQSSRTFLLVWLASIYGVCTLSTFKAIHNDIGILVPAALASGIAVASVERWRPALMTAVAVLCAVQVATFSLPEPMLAAHIGTFGWRQAAPAFPRNEPWGLDEALRGIASAPARVVVVADHPFVNGTTAEYYVARDRLPLRVSPCWAVPDIAHADLRSFDFIVVKSDLDWIRPKSDGCFKTTTGRQEYAGLLNRLERERHGFALVQSTPLPDGSELLVYRSNGAPLALNQ